MLRASSLGLRCYRPTLYRGAIRCSTAVHPSRERCYHHTAQHTPDTSDGHVSLGRMASQAERFGERRAEETGDDGGDDTIEWMSSKQPVLKVQGVLNVGKAVGKGEDRAARGEHRKKDAHVYAEPGGGKVDRKGDQNQDKGKLDVRRAFEQIHALLPGPETEAKSEPYRKPPWRSHDRDVLPLRVKNRRTFPDDPHRETRAKNLHILANTSSAADAWEAYSSLMKLPSYHGRLLVPWEYLHRLARLISNIKPRRRVNFVRLLSVVSTIHRTGGTLQPWQWNALIDFAGKGYRKLTHLNFKISLDVFTDLVSNRAPGASFSTLAQQQDQPESDAAAQWHPDIVTFTTLLDIATSTRDTKTIRYGSSLIEQSGIPSNRITYLVLLRHQARTGRTLGVRSILAQMASLGLELGLDGLNLCVWAYGRNNRLDLSSSIYRVLRANIAPESDQEAEAIRERLAEQHVPVPRDLVPDHITYTTLIQSYAYNGYLHDCIEVFTEFVSSIILPHEAQATPEDLARLYFPAYRAIFLGFFRHGEDLRAPGLELFTTGPAYAQTAYNDDRFTVDYSPREDVPNPWNSQALHAIFHDFLRMPAGAEPADRLLFWILSAFAKASGDDVQVLRSVYEQLESRFGDRWSRSGRLARIKKRIYEESEQMQEEHTGDQDDGTDYN